MWAPLILVQRVRAVRKMMKSCPAASHHLSGALSTSGESRTSTGFCRGLAPRRKGAGSGLVLDFTARERDCNGCLRESHRAKLACSVKKSGSPSLTYRVFFFIAEGTGKERRGRGANATQPSWEPPLADSRVDRKLCKESPPRWNTAARLNFQQQQQHSSSNSSPRGPGGGVNRSQVLPSTCHWQLVNIWQHASRCQPLPGFNRVALLLHLEDRECVMHGYGWCEICDSSFLFFEKI